MSLDTFLQEAGKVREYRKYHRIRQYDPYPFQKDFHFAKGFRKDSVAEQVALICANQIGKTTAGAAEATYHALGEYPDWWEGKRYNHPVIILCCGVSNDSTKRIIQKELLGGMDGTSLWGTGMIPRERLGKPTRKAGVPDAYESVQVKGKYGISEIWFMAYEQGWQKFQGIRFDYAWPDEEPPSDVWSQLLRGIIAKKNARISLTMTPEEGVTEVVDGFMNEIKNGQAIITATWEDAKHEDGRTHLTEEKKSQILAALPPHQRELRSKGIPLMGSGLVWPLSEDQFVIDSIPIPSHWSRISGIDFGIDHPFGYATIAHDRETDTIHIYDEYWSRGEIPALHAAAIRKKSSWIPIMWPHDGLARDKGSGVPLADIYRGEGLELWRDKFTNPPAPGKKEGSGGNGVEVGIIEMWQRFETGRLKVHRNCVKFLEEFRQYHRKDGVIVPLKDDVISASRYAIMSLRFAHTKPVIQRRQQVRAGATNW